ncbi:hypothetical protein, partial [Vibrio genomosp. F10]|uniref:hypothetical protein n=1 Tax=Vibrio genomosp. F10 TaxID=723171 RepID=UPI00056F7AC5
QLISLTAIISIAGVGIQTTMVIFEEAPDKEYILRSIKDIDQSLEAYYSEMSASLNADANQVNCKNFNVDLVELIDGGFLDTTNIDRSSNVTFEANYKLTNIPSPRITAKVIRLNFPSVPLATKFASTQTWTSNEGTFVTIERLIEHKGQNNSISRMYIDTDSRCWKEPVNL